MRKVSVKAAAAAMAAIGATYCNGWRGPALRGPAATERAAPSRGGEASCSVVVGDGDGPGVGVAHELTHGHVERRARRAEGHVAQELLPDHPIDVGEPLHVETGGAPELDDGVDSVGVAAPQLTDADQPHAVVVHAA